MVVSTEGLKPKGSPGKQTQEQASYAALYGSKEKETKSMPNVLDEDGRLSAAGAAASLKYAKAHELPSFPSVGIHQSSAGTAASMANKNQKPFEHWKPDASSPAQKAASLAKDYKMQPLWQPELSAAGSKAALLASRNNGLGPDIYKGVNKDEASKAMMAATGAMKQGSTPVKAAPAPERYPGEANAAANALNAATASHRASTIKRQSAYPDDLPGLSPEEADRIHKAATTKLSRDMYTAEPPVDASDINHRNSLRAAAITMAQGLYAKRESERRDRESRLAGYDTDEEEELETKAVPGATQYAGLQEAAQKLAAERLAKLHDPNQEYRDYYGQSTKSRLSFFGGSRREAGDDEDEATARQIRNQMSSLSTRVNEVDNSKRQADRDALLAIAKRNVENRLTKMDENIYNETGKSSPKQVAEWEAKARAKAQADSSNRLVTHGKVNIGGGKFLDQSEIDAIARARVQPTLDEITVHAEEQRARDKARAEEEEYQRELAAARKRDEAERDAKAREEWNTYKNQEREEKDRARAEKERVRAEERAEKERVRAEERAEKERQRAEREKAREEGSKDAPVAAAAATTSGGFWPFRGRKTKAEEEQAEEKEAEAAAAEPAKTSNTGKVVAGGAGAATFAAAADALKKNSRPQTPMNPVVQPAETTEDVAEPASEEPESTTERTASYVPTTTERTASYVPTTTESEAPRTDSLVTESMVSESEAGANEHQLTAPLVATLAIPVAAGEVIEHEAHEENDEEPIAHDEPAVTEQVPVVPAAALAGEDVQESAPAHEEPSTLIAHDEPAVTEPVATKPVATMTPESEKKKADPVPQILETAAIAPLAPEASATEIEPQEGSAVQATTAEPDEEEKILETTAIAPLAPEASATEIEPPEGTAVQSPEPIKEEKEKELAPAVAAGGLVAAGAGAEGLKHESEKPSTMFSTNAKRGSVVGAPHPTSTKEEDKLKKNLEGPSPKNEGEGSKLKGWLKNKLRRSSKADKTAVSGNTVATTSSPIAEKVEAERQAHHPGAHAEPHTSPLTGMAFTPEAQAANQQKPGGDLIDVIKHKLHKDSDLMTVNRKEEETPLAATQADEHIGKPSENPINILSTGPASSSLAPESAARTTEPRPISTVSASDYGDHEPLSTTTAKDAPPVPVIPTTTNQLSKAEDETFEDASEGLEVPRPSFGGRSGESPARETRFIENL